MIKAEVHINPDVRDAFDAAGLRRFDDFMTYQPGPNLTQGSRSRVHRISAGGSHFYIKSSARVSPGIQVRLLLAGRAHCGPLREKRMLDQLRDAGFATMEPVAWGEKRMFGFPVEGFLVVREVPGRNLGECYEEAGDHERRQLMMEVGALLGRLHRRGFFHAVRLKDLFRTEHGLVLIDRETSKPWPTRFTLRKCETLLARSLRRTAREGFQLGAGTSGTFLRSYISAMAEKSLERPGALRRRLLAGIRRELRGGRIRQSAATAVAPRAAAS